MARTMKTARYASIQSPRPIPSPRPKRRRCPNGTRKNKKTQHCEKKEKIKCVGSYPIRHEL